MRKAGFLSFGLAAMLVLTSAGHSARAATTDGGAWSSGGVTPLAGSQLAVVATQIRLWNGASVTDTIVGVAVHPYVTVAGAFGTPTGQVQGYAYDGSSCSGFIQMTSSLTSLSSGHADLTTLNYAPTVGGYISFRVHYFGNATYAARDGACTAVPVEKATPWVKAIPRNSRNQTVTSVSLGTLVHPRISAESTVGNPTGNVDFIWYANGSCSGFSTYQSPKFALVSGAVEASMPLKAPTPGTYSFLPHYYGDAAFKGTDGDCGAYTVTKAAPTFHVALHDGQNQLADPDVPVGTLIHPYATIAGISGYAAPSGTVLVQRYTDATCTAVASGFAEPVAPTMEFSSLRVGSDVPAAGSWRLTYQGDALYQAVASACYSVRWKGIPSVSLTIRNGAGQAVTTVNIGASVHPYTLVTGAFSTPTGTVVVTWYGNGTCSGAGTSLPAASLSSGAKDDIAHAVTLDTPGTYSARAAYSGSTTYLTGLSTCKAITVTIPATPGPTASPTPAPTVKPTSTPAPTAAPSAPPAPTGTPGPTSAPTSGPGSSSGPDATTLPDQSVAPLSSDAPAASTGSAEPSWTPPAIALGGGTGASASPGSAGQPGTTDGGDSSSDGASWIVLLLLVLLLLAGLFLVARRKRQVSGAVNTNPSH